MLPAEKRLRAKRDFDLLWKRGRSVYGRSLGIKFAPNGLEQSRFAAIAGLKVHKRANKRNLVKRRVREALRKEFAAKIHGLDVAVIVQAGAADSTYKQIVAELSQIFHKARLI